MQKFYQKCSVLPKRCSLTFSTASGLYFPAHLPIVLRFPFLITEVTGILNILQISKTQHTEIPFPVVKLLGMGEVSWGLNLGPLH